MTSAQIDLAHKTVGDLGHWGRVIDKYENARLAAVMRIAADLLQRMIDEHEAAELGQRELEMMDGRQHDLPGGDGHG